MNNYFKIVLISCSLLFYTCTSNQPAGTEVENERIIARVVNSDGSGAADVTITVLPVNFIPSTLELKKMRSTIVKKTSDADGYFDVSDLDDGCYNFYAQKGSFASYRDSIYLPAGVGDLVLALDSTITLCGSILVQPNHDPRITEIQILGTNYFSNASSDGAFSFPNIAPGIYQLRFVADQEGYIPTHIAVTVENTQNDTVQMEPIEILYTGIPIVNNIASIYDEAQGWVLVQWDKSTYRDLAEYIIFRDNIGVLVPSTTPIAVTSDTFYIDSVSLRDYQEHMFRYRVAVRNNSMECGPTYGFSQVTIPPQILSGSTELLNHDSLFVVGDTALIAIKAASSPSPLGRITILSLMDTVYQTDFTVTDSIMHYEDTIPIPLTSSPYFSIYCSIESVNGRNNMTTDSLSIHVYDTLPQPGDSLDQPGDSLDQPGDSLDQPGDSLGQPGDSLGQPGDSLSFIGGHPIMNSDHILPIQMAALHHPRIIQFNNLQVMSDGGITIYEMGVADSRKHAFSFYREYS